MTGSTSYHAGLAAEAIVERHYEREGARVLARRWRDENGELDLVVSDGDAIVFVEVKKSKSFANAASRLSNRQILRIQATASGYLATTPLGQSSNVRFDVALVDGIGAVQVIQNAFGH